MRRIPEETRFWALVNKAPSCWLWTAYRSKAGYGRFGFSIHPQGQSHIKSWKSCFAHRYSWQFHNGPIPPGLNVLHHCDTPACVNPEHLFLGTQKDNADDMMAKGRGNGQLPTGENHPDAKLSVEQVLEVRSLAEAGWSIRALGRRFGVNSSTIVRIKNRQLWRQV